MARVWQSGAIGSAILVALLGASAARAVPVYTCTGTQCGGALGSYSGEPRYGSPNSMPIQVAQNSLDLTDPEPEEAASGPPQRDADTIGAAFTYYWAGFQQGQRYEFRYQHARRLGEGTRARLLIDLPIAANHVNEYGVKYDFGGGSSFGPFYNGGHTAVYGTLNVGVEIPVKPNWLITPRINYSNLQAGNYFGYDAEQIGGSVTSRFKLPQVGRGDLTIGNFVGYGHSINTFLSKQPFYDDTHLWTLRNGLAYQLPLKMRMFGRQTSIRASYTATYMTGVGDLPYKWIHELGLSVGVRTREAEQKNRFEQLRIGLLYTRSHNEFSSAANYDSVTMTLGYRF